MKKKAKRKIAITLVLLFIVASVFLIFNFSGVLQTILPHAGCDFIKNTNEPTSSYTETLNSGIFTCDTDRCIVSGSMKLSNPTATPKVIFRYEPEKDVWGYYKELSYAKEISPGFFTNLESYIQSGSGSSSSTANLLTCRKTPEGFCVTEQSSGIYIWNREGGRDFTVYRKGGSADISSIPKYSCQSQEVCQAVQTYSAKFNFCPSSDIFFPYCQGDKNSVTSTEVGRTFYTEEKEILKGESISFDPKYDSGESVAEKIIRVKKYDCSCLPAVEDGTACSSNQVKCKPTGTCKYNRGTYPSCSYGIDSTEYTSYQKCDGTQPINQATCGAFTSSSYSCPTGQQCYVTATGKVGEGIGGCRCSDDKCILGQKIKGNSPTTYKECITIGNCVDWSSERTCASGLVFDILLNDCVCSPTTSCVPQSSECVGDLIRNCIVQNLGDKICYNWDSSARQCPGNLKCDSLGTSDKDDVCSCKDIETCNAGEIKCTSLTEYDICSKDPNDINSCLTFRDLGNTVGEFQQCINNQITQREDIGCAFGTSSSVCSTKKDINGVLIEQCINNQCVSPTDKYTATESDFLNQRTKCFGNEIKKVVKYEGNKLISYRWETKTDVKYSTLGVCGEDYICIEYLSGQAQCSISAEFVGILTESSYGINTKINNVTVSITDNVPNRANMGITARILDGGVEVSGTRINTFTDGNGMVTINFDYAHPRSGDLVIDIVANPSGTNYKGTKTIKVLPTLNLKLNCPALGYANTKVSCSWKVENIDTGKLIDVDNLGIIVNQGGTDLAYNPIGRTGLEFTTGTLGGVLVKVSANKNEFISDTEQTNVPIESLTQSQTFKIDNVDYFSNNIISTGTHQLSIEVKNNLGTPLQVQNVVGEVITPTGQSVKLSFNKISEGNFKAIANFPTASQTYNVKGTIIFPDVTKDNILFEYQINTLGTATEKQQMNIIYLIIAGSVIALIIIFIIVLILKRKK